MRPFLRAVPGGGAARSPAFFTRDHEPRAGISPFAPVGNGLQSGRNWALIAKSSVLLQRRAPLIDLQWNRAALPPFVTREMKSL